MKLSKQQEYISILETKQLPISLLLTIVAVIEPKISKAAYTKAKYKNLTGGKDENFYYLIGIRDDIHRVLKHLYTLEQLKIEASKIDKDLYPTQKTIDEAMVLLRSGDYKLIS